MKQTIVNGPMLRSSSPSVRHTPSSPQHPASSSSSRRSTLMFRSPSRPSLSSFLFHARKSLFYGTVARPKAQFVTTFAVVCVLFAFVTFLRSAAIVPAHPTILPTLSNVHFHHNDAGQFDNNKREHQQYRYRLRSRLRRLRAKKKKRVNNNNDDDASSWKNENENSRANMKRSFVNHTRVVSADGSLFLVALIERGGQERNVENGQRQRLVNAKHDEDDQNNNNKSNNDNNDNDDSMALDFDIRMTTSKSTLHVHTLLPAQQHHHHQQQQQQHQLDIDIIRIAFFIQVSSCNIRMLPRLLLKLWHPSHTYVIHFDWKIGAATSENFKRAIHANKALSSNVFFLPSDEITYKGVSMLLNTLSAMEYLLVLRAAREWTYFINISGADYPLVNAGVMGRVLGSREIRERNMTFLQIAADKKFWNQMKHSRFDHIFYDTALSSTVNGNNNNNNNGNDNTAVENSHHHHHNTALIKTWVSHPLLSKPDNNNDNDSSYQFIQAEAWIIAHHDFVHHAVHSSYARKLLLYLSLMQDPEEHFFAMLAWNSPRFNRTLGHHALRAIFWEYNGKMAGQHPYYVDEYNATLRNFPFWERHVRASPCFFVRKVQHPRSALLTRIDRYMSGTTHLVADLKAVAASVATVRRFVDCIARRPHPSGQIHTYNVCH